jgi:hypothetical protein
MKTSQQLDDIPHSHNKNPVGIYGWRKRFLYLLVLILIAVVCLNIAMTVWILAGIRFNLEGLGFVKITYDGLQVEGESQFLDSIYAQNIVAATGHQNKSELNLYGHDGIDMNVENSKIQVTSDQVKVKTQNFIVQSITRYMYQKDKLP